MKSINFFFQILRIECAYTENWKTAAEPLLPDLTVSYGQTYGRTYGRTDMQTDGWTETLVLKKRISSRIREEINNLHKLCVPSSFK